MPIARSWTSGFGNASPHRKIAKKRPRRAQTAKLRRRSRFPPSEKKRNHIARHSKLVAGKPIADVGHTLDVQYALEGSVRRGGNQIRIDVQLIQVSDQTHLWADSYTGNIGDILRVQDEVAAAVASHIRVALPVGALALNGAKGTSHAINPQAYDE